MKWKTSTIILILMVSIGTILFFYFDKQKEIKQVNDKIEFEINEGVSKSSEEIQNQFKSKIENLEIKNQKLEKKIEALKERNAVLAYGGQIEKNRNQLKANSIKKEEKIKIRKGEIYKHKKSGLIVYVKKDFYENEVFINFTQPDRETEETQWQIGKYYYIFNPLENDLHQIMPTFIDDLSVELDWTYYKGKKKEKSE